MNIAIESWCVWPSQADGSSTCLFFRDGQYGSATYEKPELANVPPMQKRRLSKLARIVFHVLDFCSDDNAQVPVVFSSVMGEIKRTQGILKTIASDEPVSPAAFSLSVHNSIGGLWSLIRGIKAPMLAIAPVAGSPMAALIEAAGLLAEGSYEAVTVVYYDEDYPAFYDPYIKGPVAPYALALKLVCPGEVAEAGTIRLDLQQHTLDENSPEWESPLELLAVLKGEQASSVIREPRSQWQLDRQC